MRKDNPWKCVNKCLVCGTNLKFVPSDRKDAQPQEGMKICEQNHARFTVVGGFGGSDIWNLTFHLPVS